MVCRSEKLRRRCVLGRYLLCWRLELRRDSSYCEALTWDWCLPLHSDSAITWSNVVSSVPTSGDNVQSVWGEDEVLSCSLGPPQTGPLETWHCPRQRLLPDPEISQQSSRRDCRLKRTVTARTSVFTTSSFLLKAIKSHSRRGTFMLGGLWT